MKVIRFPMLLTLAVALFSLSIGTGDSEARRQKMGLNDILKMVKPGQWVEVEGKVQNDKTVLCSEIKFLTGDFLDDDWAIDGVVERIDKMNQEVTLLKLPAKFHKDTEFEPDDNKAWGFEDLKTGMFVEMEGTYQKDGKLLVKSIENESGKLNEEPDLKHDIALQGRVSSVDKLRARVTVMGIEFKLNQRTKGKSALK